MSVELGNGGDFGTVSTPTGSIVGTGNPLLQLERITMDPAHDRGRVHINASLLHHLGQIAIGVRYEWRSEWKPNPSRPIASPAGRIQRC
jgi:hypothetical protein